MKSNYQIRSLACRIAQGLLPFTLLACGGGSTAEYESAFASANQKEAESKSLGVDAPCATSDQCGVLYFGSASRACGLPAAQVYSLVSATAKQAEKAAEEQRALAARALELAPGNDGLACPLLGTTPIPVCVANRCIAEAAR
jgi:hypothetical protein